VLVWFSRTQACAKIRHKVTSIRDCLSAHLETKLEFAYTVVASLQVWPDSCLNFVNLTHPRAGRQYLPMCGDPPKATYRSLSRSVVASLQVWPDPCLK
jgi:hypothetical protein